VLVYTLDRREPEKRERAREVLRLVGGAGTPAPRRDPLQTPVEDLQHQFARLSAQRARTTRSRDSFLSIQAFRRASGSLSAARDASAEPLIQEVVGSRVERVPIIPSLRFYL
jgi:hypothetical protein